MGFKGISVLIKYMTGPQEAPTHTNFIRGIWTRLLEKGSLSLEETFPNISVGSPSRRGGNSGVPQKKGILCSWVIPLHSKWGVCVREF